MTEVDHPAAGPSRSSRLVHAAAPALLLSIGATAWCWWACRNGLGLFLGSTLLATLYVPALVLYEPPVRRWIPVIAAVVGTAIVWAVSLATVDVTAWEWLRCCLVLAAYLWAVAGIASMLSLIRVPAPLASALAIIAGFLWLTWPVWLSHALTQGLVSWLVPIDPLMAVNAVLKHLGTWDHQPIAYRSLTVLNQDVAYHLPRSIMPAFLFHLLLGASGILLPLRWGRGAGRPWGRDSG